MNLTTLYLNGLNMTASSMTVPNFKSNSSKEGFDSYLSKANNVTESRKYNDSNNVKKDTNKAASNQNSKKELNNNVSNNEKNNKNDSNVSDKKEASSTSSKKENVSKKTSNDSTVKDDSQIQNNNEQDTLKNIADALSVPVDTIKEILQQLNMTVDDLNDSNNLINFMQKVTGSENVSQLLSVNGIKDMFKAVKDILSDFNNQNQVNLTNVSTEIEEDNTNNQELVSDNQSKSVATVQNASKNMSNAVKNTNENVNINENNNNNKINANTNNLSTSQQVSATNKETFNQQSSLGNNHSNQLENAEQILQTGNSIHDNVTKVFNESLSKAGAKKNINASDVINQIVDKFKAEVKGEVSEIKITLRPEYLGDVSLKIASQNGVVTAQFTAENQRIKEIIEDNFNNLKQMLTEKGIEVSQLSVSVGSEESQGNAQEFMMNQGKSSKRINSIISNSSSEDDDLPQLNDINYIDEGEIIENNVNYKA